MSMNRVRTLVAAVTMPVALLINPGRVAPTASSSVSVDALDVIDQTNSIRVSVPAGWTDIDTAPQPDGAGSLIPSIVASTDLGGFRSGSFDVPGVSFVALAPTADTAQLVLQGQPAPCTDAGVAPYADGAFIGSVRIQVDCGGTPMRSFTIAANPIDRSFTAFLEVRLTDADEMPLELIATSFDAASAPIATSPNPAVVDSAVPLALIGSFQQDRNVVAPAGSPVQEERTLTLFPDGTYALTIENPSRYTETGTVRADEEPCLALTAHTGSIEFVAHGAVDPVLTISGPQPARWTVGVSADHLANGAPFVDLLLQFGDLRNETVAGGYPYLASQRMPICLAAPVAG
jgi:hypothetical protein